jgi:hypothetical protein
MDYFKHYSTASDSKSMNILFDKHGHKGIAFWWMLVELCAENWDGISEPEFNFHQRTVVTKLKSSLNSVRTWLELCSNSGLCAFAQNETQFEIKLPKLREIKETRGRIKGNKPEKIDILDKEKEEDKDLDKDYKHAKKILPIVSPQENLKKPSPLSVYFSDSPEIQEWLNAGIHETHLMLLKKYSHHEVVDLVLQAYSWAAPRQQQAGTWLYTFVSNKTTQAYGSNRRQNTKSRTTPGNPTGNPYLNDDGSLKEQA